MRASASAQNMAAEVEYRNIPPRLPRNMAREADKAPRYTHCPRDMKTSAIRNFGRQNRARNSGYFNIRGSRLAT